MITADRPNLSISRQCAILSLSRSSFYYRPKSESEENLGVMRRIDEVFLTYPFYGSRQMVRRGFLYLVAVMDWATRRVLSWRLSNTMDAGFCVEALDEALERYGRPEIFNTDQGSPFTSFDFTNVLKEAGAPSPWTAGAGAWTTSSSNGCGVHSSTRRCICTN